MIKFLPCPVAGEGSGVIGETRAAESQGDLSWQAILHRAAQRARLEASP